MANEYSSQAKGGFESADQDFSDSDFNGISGVPGMQGGINMMPGSNGTHGHRNGAMSGTPPVNNTAGTNGTAGMNDGAIGNGTNGYRNGVLSGANSLRNGGMGGPPRMGSMGGMNGTAGMNGTTGMNGTAGTNSANIYRDGALGGPPGMGAYRGSAMKRSYSRVDPDIEKLKALRKKRSTATITITPELLEKMDATPQEAVKGDIRKSLGNPTPM